MYLLPLITALDRHHQLFPVVGIELEFYLRDSLGAPALVLPTVTEDLNCFLQSSISPTISCKPERGKGQFELIFGPLSCLQKIISITYEAQSAVIAWAEKRGWLADFTPKPFSDDFGSSLQINISLHKSASKYIDEEVNADVAACQNLDHHLPNIFSYGSPKDNHFLTSCISGILTITNPCLDYLLAEDPSHLARFTPGFMAPVNLSWGINNRTVSIRVPDSHSKNRRLEYRIGGSGMRAESLLTVCLAGSLLGLNSASPASTPPIYGDASDPQYSHTLLPLPRTIAMIKELAQFPNIIEKQL